MPKVKLTNPTPGEYTILEGSAPAPREYKAPKSIKITGTLGAVAQFLEGKKNTFKPEESHLQIFGIDGVLRLFIHDTSPETTHEITGQLKPSQHLGRFKIGTGHLYSVQELLKTIKENRYFFPDKEAHTRIVGGLQKWHGQIETIMKVENDQKGNNLYSLENKVKTAENFVPNFSINVPLFEGDVAFIISVELGIEVQNGMIKIYLFSDDLIEKSMERIAFLMKEALGDLSSYTFSKVIVN